MASIGSISINLAVRTSDFTKGLRRGKAEIQSFGSSLSSLRAGVAGLAAALGTGAVIAGFGKAARAAADLEEETSKVGVVFGESAKIVEASAEDLADRFGIVRSEFKAGASNIGLILTGMGATESAAAGLSAQFAELAADAASFFNTSFEDALGAIRSGLTGETEPLKRFGVILTETAVKEYAVAAGIAEAGRELTNQQKVAARVALITQGLGKAQGDLARTADSVANRMRTSSGRAENAWAALGQAIRPVTVALQEIQAGALEGLEASLARNQSLIRELSTDGIGAFQAFGNAIGWVWEKIVAASEAGSNQLALIFADVISALAAGYQAVESVIGGSTGDSMAEYAQRLREDAFARRNEAMNTLLNGRPEELAAADNLAPLASAASGAASGFDELTEAAKASAAATDKVGEKIADMTADLRAEIATFGQGADAAEMYRLRLQGADATALAELETLRRQRQALEDSADARKDMEKAAEKAIEAARTPLESFKLELARLQQLRDTGLIDSTTFGRREEELRKDLREATGEDDTRPAAAAALTFGSKEARSAVLAARGTAGDPAREQAKTQKDQLAESKRQTALLSRVAEGIAGTGVIDPFAA